MFGWFKSKTVLPDEWRDWIDWRFDWLLETLGDSLLHQPTKTPSHSFLPTRYAGTRDDAKQVFCKVCGQMDVNPDQLELKFYHRQGYAKVVKRGGDQAAGLYDRDETGRIVIWLEESQLDDPTSIISTCAHELAHVRLLADRPELIDEPDHEHLTDLLTIFAGFGVFMANSSRQDRSWIEGTLQLTSVQWQGYMTMPAIAYALARRSHAQKEDVGPWIKLLRADARSDLKQELAALKSGQRRVWCGPVGAPPESALTLSFEPAHMALQRKQTPSEDARHESTEPSNESQLREQNDITEDLANPEFLDESSTPDGSDAQEHTELHSNFSEADELFSLGVQLANDHNYLDAIATFTEAIQITPDDSEIYLERGKANLIAGNFQDAIHDLTKRLDVAPEDLQALRCRATALLEIGRSQEAMNDNHRIHDVDKHASDYLTRGLIYCRTGELKRALNDLSRAITSDPFLADSYLARSRVYRALGEEKLASRDYDEALRRNPDFEDPQVRCSTLAERVPVRT